MKTVVTDEKDERFLELVRELDKGYYRRIGDELSRYDEYNSLEKPHVVILLIDSNTNVACASYRVMSDDSVELMCDIIDLEVLCFRFRRDHMDPGIGCYIVCHKRASFLSR